MKYPNSLNLASEQELKQNGETATLLFMRIYAAARGVSEVITYETGILHGQNLGERLKNGIFKRKELPRFFIEAAAIPSLSIQE